MPPDTDKSDSHHGRLLHLDTPRGPVACAYYAATETVGAAVFVGGAGGGWSTPARDLYPQLCAALPERGIAALRVRFRNPERLDEAVYDIVAGLAYLHDSEGIEHLALVGHSFGGAAVIRAAAYVPMVRTVVTLATQSQGVEPIGQLAPRCSILLLHGTADAVLPPGCSRFAYELAGEPKELILYPGVGHDMDEVASELFQGVRDWISDQLTAAASSTR